MTPLLSCCCGCLSVNKQQGPDVETGLVTALAALGVRVVDRRAVPEECDRIFNLPESEALVQALTITGMLEAIRKSAGTSSCSSYLWQSENASDLS